jgi:DNA-binding transcriptional ArsR family regulator
MVTRVRRWPAGWSARCEPPVSSAQGERSDRAFTTYGMSYCSMPPSASGAAVPASPRGVIRQQSRRQLRCVRSHVGEVFSVQSAIRSKRRSTPFSLSRTDRPRSALSTLGCRHRSAQSARSGWGESLTGFQKPTFAFRHPCRGQARPPAAGSGGYLMVYFAIMRNDDTKRRRFGLLQTLKAIASPVRMEILRRLRKPTVEFPPQVDGDPVSDGICADFIRERLGIAAATASRHLTLLTDAGLLIATRKKGWTFYRRDNRAIERLAKQIKAEL